MTGERMTEVSCSADFNIIHKRLKGGLGCVLSENDLEEDKIPQECTDTESCAKPLEMDSGLSSSFFPPNHEPFSKYRFLQHNISSDSQTERVNGIQETTQFSQDFCCGCENISTELDYFNPKKVSTNFCFDNMQQELVKIKLNQETPVHESMLVPTSARSVENKGRCSMCFGNVSIPEVVLEIYSQDADGDNKLHVSIIREIPEYSFEAIAVAPDSDWLNITNDLSQTALHLAVITRQVGIVRRLMVGGADITIMDAKGNTPLHLACKEGYTEIVFTLLNPVHYEELQQNRYDIIYQKIPQDLRVKNYDGQTCLHLATIGSHVDVMKQLLSRGVDINVQDGKSGRTALHYATENSQISIVEFLLTVPGLNIDAETYGEETAFMLALGRNLEKIANLLIVHGAQYQYGISDNAFVRGIYDSYGTFS